MDPQDLQTLARVFGWLFVATFFINSIPPTSSCMPRCGMISP